jgi:hypothetical protein
VSESIQSISSPEAIRREPEATAYDAECTPSWAAVWWFLPERELPQIFLQLLPYLVYIPAIFIIHIMKRRQEQMVRLYNEERAQRFIDMEASETQMDNQCHVQFQEELDSIKAFGNVMDYNGDTHGEVPLTLLKMMRDLDTEGHSDMG